MIRWRLMLVTASAAAIGLGFVSSAQAQFNFRPLPVSGLTLEQIHQRELPPSEARGAPLPPIAPIVGPSKFLENKTVSAENGAAPAGYQNLPRDVFNTTDFYADKDLWMDKSYYRCGSPISSENIWNNQLTGDNFPATVAWGMCDRDYPRENMVSPYKFKSAQEHFEALKAEAATRGGPTKYTHDNQPPDWNGTYNVNGFGQNTLTRTWLFAGVMQVPTYLSLLTPEYQQRYVQMFYHQAHNQEAWQGAYCWPDGFEHSWFRPSAWVMTTPQLTQIRAKVNEALVQDVYMDRDFKQDDGERVPNLSVDVRQYMGESVGFWDGEILVIWTSNIKHWVGHGWFETSDNFQVIEIYTPLDGPDNKFIGLLHESILYDQDAFVEPLRIIEQWEHSTDLNDPQILPIGWTPCTPSLFPIEGYQTPVNAGTVIQYTVPDFSGRPWADIWETYFEQGMKRPDEKDDVLSGF